jgi:hypothetical protein
VLHAPSVPALCCPAGGASCPAQSRILCWSLPAGLPEEVAHTKQCLARGYAVLAVASKDRTKLMCFSSAGDPSLSELAAWNHPA